MLVYCTTLSFSSETSIDHLLKIVTDWLSQQTGKAIQASLRWNIELVGSSRYRIKTAAADDEYPWLYSIRYTRPDPDVAPRTWIFEVGLSKESHHADTSVSILVRTEDASPQPLAPVKPAEPWIVHTLLQEGCSDPSTPGRSVLRLDTLDDATVFNHHLLDENRAAPYVLVSPTPNGSYLVNVEELRFRLEGVANVVQIPPHLDTRRLADIIGRHYTVWGGAVNVIFRPVRGDDAAISSPTRRLLPRELNAMTAPTNDLFAAVIQYTNLRHSWQHLSHEAVVERRRWRQYNHLRATQDERAQQTDGHVRLLEQDLADRLGVIKELQSTIEQLEAKKVELEQENRTLKYHLENAKFTLDSRIEELAVAHQSGAVKDVLLERVSQYLTLEDSLKVIGRLFDTRIVILDTAWRSARAAHKFDDRQKAFRLLWLLATDYWDLLRSKDGKGDAEARYIFGDAFRARESQTVENNHRAKQARTFIYNNQPVEMMRHLAIGNKPSKAETLRIHFHWDVLAGKIVIGHCGEHLPHG